MYELIIVIPVYNESKIIKTVAQDWITNLEPLNINYRIKLYNDGSTDNTLVECKKIAGKYPDLIEVIDKANSGHGPTILKAYKENLDCDWIFQVDSDNEISASYFNSLWVDREFNDLVIGIRRGRTSSLSRKIITFISNMTVKLFYGKGIIDVNIPYRLMRVSVFKDHFQNIPSGIFTPNIIISGIAVKEKKRIKSIIVEYKYRNFGESSLGENVFKLFKISIKSFREVLAYAYQKK